MCTVSEHKLMYIYCKTFHFAGTEFLRFNLLQYFDALNFHVLLAVH